MFDYFKVYKSTITASKPTPSSHKINTVLWRRGTYLFPLNEMDLKFGKIVIFSSKYNIVEIRKGYSMALVFTFDIP